MDFVELARRVGRDDELGDPEPYANLAWLRESAPISRLPGPGGDDDSGFWLVTSHQLARECLSDPRLSFDPGNARVPQHAPGHTPYVLAKDPPEHTTLRAMVNAAFSPGAVGRLRQRIEGLCEATIATFARRGTVDLFTEFALPIPELVAYEFFGIAEDDRMPPGRATELSITIAMCEQYAGGPATDEMHRYIARVMAHAPAGGDGLIGAALAVLDRGEATEHTILGMLYLLFATGQLSTAPFIAAAVIRALQHGARVPGGPHRWRPFVNEVLRHDSPVQTSMPRFALEDLTLGGEHIAKGETVFVSIAGANRDPAAYTAPDDFRLDRRSQNHLAFGFGVHFCVGAPLARLEAEIALDTLFTRLPTLELAVPVAELVWTLGPMLRCAREIPARFTVPRPGLEAR